MIFRKDAVASDPQLQQGNRGARKLVVTGLYENTEEPAVDIEWQPPLGDNKCQVHVMSNTELAHFNQHAEQDRHFHKIGTEIYMVLEGSMAICVEGKDYVLCAGDMILVKPGDVHEVKSADSNFLCRVITIDCAGSTDKFIV